MNVALKEFKLIDINDVGLFDIGGEYLSDELKGLVLDCVREQKRAGAEQIAAYKPDSESLENVSEKALRDLLQEGKNVHGISSERSISNGICFGASHIEDAVNDPVVAEKREKVDLMVAKLVNDLFDTSRELTVVSSGLFWYPKECSMGWHTNSKAPGWRIYINYAEQENASFFRFQDPKSSELVTLDDKTWNFRIFRVTDERPLWHSIYSNTNRFSFGYRVKIPSAKRSILRKIKRRLTGF